MNTATPFPHALLAQMATLVDCGRAEGFVCLSARREHGARSVDIPRPQLTILLQGRKQVRTATRSLQFVPGDLLLVAQPCRIDMVNVPDPASGTYLSAVIPLCEEVLVAARALWNEPLPADTGDIAQLPAAEFEQPLLQWRASLEQGRYIEARLALAALVVALCRRGHSALLLPPPPSLAARVRALVAAQPQRDWRSRDIEDLLGLSGATLRRHLAAEHTSLRRLVADARLAHAMELLYTTRWPLKTVAAKVGYRSASSFSRRFQQRYGLDPADIGNA
ncbi:helix-turn-helix transcriptional regulator [Stenotrophomonas sp. MMGLT7]|uniref:helix-turn-helix transcriptional regulator n=1 Tax=Stenotrophomonas sp. MMGLT7 TaxID=2901227 RepID=UPI001E3A1873|nr:helix-turn-helix transcriptional regulator [Stenotrophomonas sp. MMGLT7]MCD7099945.1 helix-turn-helix transcriptional regulator [Stenotrophomonas sp. MMGLT7]